MHIFGFQICKQSVLNSGAEEGDCLGELHEPFALFLEHPNPDY